LIVRVERVIEEKTAAVDPKIDPAHVDQPNL